VTFSKKISLSKNPFLSDFSLHPRPDLVFSLLPLKSKSFLHNVDKAAAAVRRGCDQPPYHHAQISAGNFFSGSSKFWAVFFVGAVFGLLGFRAQVEGVVLYRWSWRGSGSCGLGVVVVRFDGVVVVTGGHVMVVYWC
jgi:hypothetical protein